MVATQFDSFEFSHRFLIRPNCSLPWRGVVRFYLGMFSVSFSIAFAFALKGVWFILPFAGLEMLVLGAAFYVVARRGSSWQAISVSDTTVDIVDSGVKSGGQQSFQRAWVRIDLERAAIKGYPSRLLIRSHGRAMEVGGYLNETEKQRLAQELREAVSRYQ